LNLEKQSLLERRELAGKMFGARQWQLFIWLGSFSGRGLGLKQV
jgi:hypothetical protein